jgi:hypothetical protein
LSRKEVPPKKEKEKTEEKKGKYEKREGEVGRMSREEEKGKE